MKHLFVSYETALKLKEKGYNEPSQYLYVSGNYRINYEKEGDLFNNGYYVKNL